MHDSKAAIGLETMAMTKAWTMMAAAAAVTACALTPLAAAAEAAAPASRQASADPLATLIGMERRVAPIIARLMQGSARWCPQLMPTPGWLLGDPRQYRAAVWNRARPAYGASGVDAPFIAALDPGGAAAAAGVMPGDAVTAINGVTLSGDGDDPYARMAQAHALLAAADPRAPLTITLARLDTPLTFAAPAGCASEFRVEASEQVRARADGTLVLLYAGMLRFSDDDDELATVIAHELAHNILRHRARLNAADIQRGLAQNFGRNARLTRLTEIEADRLSVWLMADAGIDPAAAARFWTNFGKRHGGGIFAAPTHPRWKERVKLVTAEAETMRQLRAADPNAIPPLVSNPPPLE